MIIFTNKVAETLDEIVAKKAPSSVFVLVDKNTEALVLPLLQSQSATIENAEVIVTPVGDASKNLDSLSRIWQTLADKGATRHSLLINLGGGVVSDIGGFAAATFKRGMSFINVPTTLLGAVDAAVGGKTGINFNNLKNQIGVFRIADYVIISSVFFNTLTGQELRSGYAEMIKHSLLKSKSAFRETLSRYPDEIGPDEMLRLLEDSVLIKKKIVDEDPEESGMRRLLNLGHTVGHAFESLSLMRRSPLAHGYAVAYGLLTELVLSNRILSFPSSEISRLAIYINNVYPAFYFDCDDYPELIRIMTADKKNKSPEQINFTLLHDIGHPALDCYASHEQIHEALDITRDLLGI